MCGVLELWVCYQKISSSSLCGNMFDLLISSNIGVLFEVYEIVAECEPHVDADPLLIGALIR
jgi:hypothetical protein